MTVVANESVVHGVLITEVKDTDADLSWGASQTRVIRCWSCLECKRVYSLADVPPCR